MFQASLLMVTGIGLLIAGGELLVRSSSKIASFLGVSPLVIGLTVVAFGTSAPELGVSLVAALQGNPEIALANVVGSNIFNVGFILGLCAMISPLVVNMQLIKFDVPILIITSLLTFLICVDGQLNRIEGLGLFLCAVIYTVWLIRASRKESENISLQFNEAIPSNSGKGLYLQSGLALGALVILVVGSKLLVSGATDFAHFFGVSEELIGLTIVAAGTSLPEVATSVMATVRGQKDLAIGNVIGSNIYNLTLILGLASGINPKGLQVSSSILHFDLIAMVAIAMLSLPLLMTSRKLDRWEGAVLFGAYVGYTAFLLIRG